MTILTVPNGVPWAQQGCGKTFRLWSSLCLEDRQQSPRLRCDHRVCPQMVGYPVHVQFLGETPSTSSNFTWENDPCFDGKKPGKAAKLWKGAVSPVTTGCRASCGIWSCPRAILREVHQSWPPYSLARTRIQTAFDHHWPLKLWHLTTQRVIKWSFHISSTISNH